LETHQKFIIVLVAILIISNAVLAYLGVREFGIYFTVDTIIFILVTLSFNLGLQAMSRLRVLGTFLFVGYLAVAAFKIFEML
jgi:hypothetical protein